MSAELGIAVSPAATPRAALRDADIVVTITTSPTPVFDGADLPNKPVHINALGAHYPWVREVDDHTTVNSRVFSDEMEQGWAEEGEIIQPREAGLIDASHVVGDLGALVAGKGRRSARGQPSGRSSCRAARALKMWRWRRAYTRKLWLPASAPALHLNKPTNTNCKETKECSPTMH